MTTLFKMRFKLILVLFQLIFYVNCYDTSTNGGKNTLYDHTQVKPIELAAVGRVAKLGELYDARSDQFLRISLINSNLQANYSMSTHNRQTRLKFNIINTLAEKFRTLDIQAELKLSIMGGLFDLEGSGKFFKDQKRSAKSGKVSIISSFSTEYEQISITSKEIRKLIDLDALEQIDATHVVVGIQWGGNVFISVEDTNYDDQDQKKVEGNLRAQLQFLAAQISGQAQLKIDEKIRNTMSKFSFEIYGDILPETVPQTLIDAIIFMKSAPKMLMDGNEGKGKAMKYTLIPISLLRRLFKINSMINSISNKIDEATVNSCTKLFDDMNLVEQKFNDVLDELKIYEKYIESEKAKEFKDLYQNYKVFQSEAQSNLSEHLILARSGHETIDKLRNVLTQAYKHPYAFGNIDYERFSSLKREFKFLKLLSGLEVTILDKDNSLHEYLSLNFHHDIYTFFFKDEFPHFNESAFLTFRNIIDKREMYGSTAIFTAIKMDVLNENEKTVYFNFNSSTKLSLVRNGIFIVDNFEINSTVPADNSTELWSLLWKSIIPIGFLYTQLPNQSSPQELWPTMKWTEITSEYSGLFFRAEGGESEPFGQSQQANQSWISDVFYQGCWYNNWSGVDCRIKSTSLNRENWNNIAHPYKSSNPNDLLNYGLTLNHLRFYITGGEVRPKNTAIRIFKRIQ